MDIDSSQLSGEEQSLEESNDTSVDNPASDDSTATQTLEESPKRTGGEFTFAIAFAALAILGCNWLFPYGQMVFDTLGNFRWQLVLLAVTLGCVLLLRRRFGWAFLIFLFAAWPAYRLIDLYRPASAVNTATDKVSMLTVNVFHENTEYEQAMELIDELDPDIVNFIEFTYEWEQQLDRRLKQYGYRVGPEGGNVIYSKLPLLPLQDKEYGDKSDSVYRKGCTFWMDNEWVCLWLIHTTSPTSPSRLEERDLQIENLIRPIIRQRYSRHMVVAGDFNATTNCRSIAKLLDEGRLRDSRKGFGIQNTWPAWCPPLMISIDHMFVSPEVQVHERRTERSIGSDHLPVYIELSFAKHPRKLPPRLKRNFMNNVKTRFENEGTSN